MGISRNKKNRRKPKYGWGNRMALIGITTVILSLAVVVNVGATSLREKDAEYQVREAELEKALAAEKARTAQLEEYRIYVQTKQYVEKVAKEKLGLVKKDEILFKPEESE
ncbi:MAG: septum formation initiator [Lachnospiraceae bacterium]|nr:septum formation initiator [Lachnospiraceae bacterium]